MRIQISHNDEISCHTHIYMSNVDVNESIINKIPKNKNKIKKRSHGAAKPERIIHVAN